MPDIEKQIEVGMNSLVSEWIQSEHLHKNDLFVIGCSTSEVAGADIGTSGSEEIAKIVFNSLQKLQQETGVHLVFQCCEHLNRALIIERDVMLKKEFLEEVSVTPVPSAGGSMASYAFKKMRNPMVVETIQADAGIDIGETMIGMHLRRVAVPLRFQQKMIGNARVIGARTRPKLIGGKRACH